MRDQNYDIEKLRKIHYSHPVSPSVFLQILESLKSIKAQQFCHKNSFNMRATDKLASGQITRSKIEAGSPLPIIDIYRDIKLVFFEWQCTCNTITITKKRHFALQL